MAISTRGAEVRSALRLVVLYWNHFAILIKLHKLRTSAAWRVHSACPIALAITLTASNRERTTIVSLHLIEGRSQSLVRRRRDLRR